MTKIKATRPRKSGYSIFPPKDRQKLPKGRDYWLFGLPNKPLFRLFCHSRIDGISFCSFWKQNRFQKNTITVNSVYSHSGIVPKEHTLSMVFSTRNSFCIYVLYLCLEHHQQFGNNPNFQYGNNGGGYNQFYNGTTYFNQPYGMTFYYNAGNAGYVPVPIDDITLNEHIRKQM